MGSASKVKYELTDSNEMFDLVQTLKDVADNKYFTLIANKDNFRRFGESFVEYFRMLSLTSAEHPLISNKNETAIFVVVTIEGSFLGRFNNSIMRRAIAEAKDYKDVRYVGVGYKSIDTLKPYDKDMKSFIDMEAVGIYETAVAIKEYLIKEVMEGRVGKVIVCHSWPKSFEIQKPRITQLLPCEDLAQKQLDFGEAYAKVIEESEPKDVIGFLSNLWITTRLYEILIDTTIASAAAQSLFLDDSVDNLKKKIKQTHLRYRKAKRSDIDKSLRETFTARSMVAK